MGNSGERIYKHSTRDNGVEENCLRLIIGKLLQERNQKNKNHLEIYFSLDEILGLTGNTHFLQEYAANEMHDCSVENRLFRSTKQLLNCEEYDDTIENYLQDIGAIENYVYIGEDDVLKLAKSDLKRNKVSSLDLSAPKIYSIFTEVGLPYMYITSSNLALRVGYWGVHVPDNFIYRLLKNNIISREGYIKVSENVYVNIKEGVIIGEKRDKILRKMNGKRKSKQFLIIENMILYRSSTSKYASDFLMKCTKDDDDIIKKIFAEVSDDKFVTSKGGMLRFL